MHGKCVYIYIYIIIYMHYREGSGREGDKSYALKKKWGPGGREKGRKLG